eukprot:5665137-Lingulodinium_polyedra.AAC.1
MRPSDTRSTPLKATNANVAAAHERSSPSQTTMASNNLCGSAGAWRGGVNDAHRASTLALV